MRLLPYSWRGLLINDETNYISDFPDGTPLVAPSSPITVDLLESPSLVVGRRHTGPTLSILIQPVYSTSLGYRTKREELRYYLQTEQKFQFYPLIATDEDDGDRQWTINCAVLTATPKDDAFIVVFAPEKPFWKAQGIAQAQEYTAHNQTKVFTASTPAPFRINPVITLTVTAPNTGGFLYSRWLPVQYYGTAQGRGHVSIPYNFGPINTAALVTAGKAQADGDDVRLFINDVEVPSWFSGWNTTTTKIWAEAPFGNVPPVLLRTDPGVGAISEILIVNDATNQANFALWPASGEFIINSEGFRYTAKDPTNMKVTGVTRAWRGTASAAHPAGQHLFFQPFTAVLRYGNSALTAPNYPTSKQPLLDLTTSTNTSWVWDFFTSDNKDRIPYLNLALPSGKANGLEWYFDTHGDTPIGAGTPLPEDLAAEVVGLRAIPVAVAGSWVGYIVNAGWELDAPWRMTTVVASGEKRASANSSMTMGISVLSSTAGWVSITNIPFPSPLNTWQPWSSSIGPFSSSVYRWRMSMLGTAPAAPGTDVKLELQNLTVNFVAGDVPVTVAAPEVSAYTHDITLYNDTTGRWIRIIKNVRANSIVVIDTLNHTVRVDGVPNASGIYTSDKTTWFDLASGANNVRAYDVGLAGVNVTMVGDAKRNV